MNNIKKNILIIDDDPAILMMVSISLKKFANYNVYQSQNIEEAIKTLNNEKIDIILSDYCIDETNGENILEKILSNDKHKKIPVIFLTAKNDPNLKSNLINLGAKGLINKPFKPPNLHKEIDNILNS